MKATVSMICVEYVALNKKYLHIYLLFFLFLNIDVKSYNYKKIYASMIVFLLAMCYVYQLTYIPRDKIIAEKLLYIPNDDTPDYPFCILQIVVETFGQST